MYRVGIYTDHLLKWNGGSDFIYRITDAMIYSTTHSCEFKAVILIGADPRLLTDRQIIRDLRLSRVKLHPTQALPLVQELAERSFEVADTNDHYRYSGLSRYLHSFINNDVEVCFYDSSRPWGLTIGILFANIDILLPLIEPPLRPLPIPIIAYIYDLQHIHMPVYFDPREAAARNQCFSRLGSIANTLLFNSKYILNEFLSSYCISADKTIFSLPFAPQARPDWLTDKGCSCLAWARSCDYVIVCNQFWAHKNHQVVLEAFEQISGLSSIHLVFTGEINDYRGSGHIERFFKKLNEMPSSGRVHVLGHIDKAQQIYLLKNALLLVQPSKYEGGPGGGAVYDAISLGVPVLLSDIEVNKECSSPWFIDYFSVDDAGDLAEKIHQFMDSRNSLIAASSSNLASLSERSRNQVAFQLLQAIRSATEPR